MMWYQVHTTVGPKIIRACGRPTCTCLERFHFPVISIDAYESHKKCRAAFRFPECVKTRPTPFPPSEETPPSHGH